MVSKNYKYDLLYTSAPVKKFIANLFKVGKAQKFETFFFAVLRDLKSKICFNPLAFFLFILDSIKPVVELKSIRLGSVSYKIPVPCICRKQLPKAIKSLRGVVTANTQPIPIVGKIKLELSSIFQKKSILYKTNQSLYQTASNNRAFAHYRWS
jgi:small subunit ribosomal protein S7